MRIVKDRVHQRAVRVEVNISGSIGHRQPRGCAEVQFVAERADRHVERYGVAVPGKVAIDLALPIAEGINGETKAGRPVISVGVVGMELLARPEVGIGRALHTLLLPTPPNVHRDMAIGRPGIVHVGGMVIAVRVEWHLAELASGLAKVHTLYPGSRNEHSGASTRRRRTESAGCRCYAYLECGIAD